MRLTLKAIDSGVRVKSDSLRARAEKSSKSAYTHHYLVYDEDSEVAFLSLDIRPNVDYLVLYEIFVKPELRHQGIGSRLLLETEKLAKNLGLWRIILNPEPFERNFSREALVNWYRKKGYVTAEQCPIELEKHLE